MVWRAEQTIEAYCAAYLWRDFDQCLDLMEDDVFSGWVLDRNAVSFAGLRFGKREALKRFQRLDQLFEPEAYAITRVLDEGRQRAIARIHYRSHHRASGVEIDGTVLIDFRFRGTRMIRSVHYHDRHRLEAFFRLVKARKRDTV